MRWRVYLSVVFAGILVVPFPSAIADNASLQEQYLRIYLKMNDAEHLEKQGDYDGALDDFKDCYTKLAKIHTQEPEWEAALVLHRMDDCKAKILELQSRKPSIPTPPPPPVIPNPVPTPANASVPARPLPPLSDLNDVASLKKRLQQVEADLQATRDNLKASQSQVEAYKAQLETVNQQLKAIKNKPSVDDRLTKLLNENKALTDKLTAAQKQIDSYKVNPKSKLALAQAQLKNIQDQFDASQEAQKTLQQTVTTLQQHLDQVQADLTTANAKLAAAGPSNPEYQTIKRENEVMRGILQHELQEQARRDQAKRLAQEEFDNLKLKSTVLQEQLDILGSPMAPATTDEERELLAGLKAAGPGITPPPSAPTDNPGAGFAAPATNTSPVTPAPPAPDTTQTTPPPSTNAAPTTALSPPSDTTVTNQPPVAITNPETPSTNTPPTAPTNTVTTVTPPVPPTPDTNAPVPPQPTPPAPSTADTNATPPISPNPPPTPPAPDLTNAAPPATTNTDTPTVSNIPGSSTTTVTDTTIVQGKSNTPDATQYANNARLPDDMRETAQQAADLFKMQRYDEAAAKYQSIIDKYPESLYAWSNLGVVRFQQGDLNDALKALQQAVKLKPTDAFSYSNLGIVYYQMNQYENAISALNTAKALDPNDAKTRNYLGCACSQKGWQEVAEKEFRKAIELDPNFGDAHFNLALVYATSKPPSIELARREYNRALELGIAKDERLEKLLKQ